jgi:carbamoyltransferase
MPDVILGINAFHADAAACLVVDGKLVAAAEEERFCRVKHWAGFPAAAAKYCLAQAGLSVRDVRVIALNRDPGAHLGRKFFYMLAKRPGLKAVSDRFKNSQKIRSIKSVVAEAFGVPESDILADIHNVEHHRAHLASSFFVSPFPSAAVVSVDGFGDFVSTMWGRAEGLEIGVEGQVYFPHSLGLLYLAFTQYLGFHSYGDEYKVMGLAAYGKPAFMDKMDKVVRMKPGGGFELDLSYFQHDTEGVSMVWEKGSPVIGKVFSKKLEALFGPARRPDEPVAAFHQDVAHSLQKNTKKCFSIS